MVGTKIFFFFFFFFFFCIVWFPKKININKYNPHNKQTITTQSQKYHFHNSQSKQKSKQKQNKNKTKTKQKAWLRNRRKRGAYKGRTFYDVNQVRALEWIFSNYSEYPSILLKKQLAEEVNMTYPQVCCCSFSFSFSFSSFFFFFFFFFFSFFLIPLQGPKMVSIPSTKRFPCHH